MESFKIAKLFDITDKVVVVTGGGSGIGLMFAKGLITNGAKVYISGRRKEKLEKAASELNAVGPGKCFPVVCDVTSKNSIKAFADEIAKHEKYIDVLVNNAGVGGKGLPKDPERDSREEILKEMWDTQDEKSWEDTFKTNVTGPYLVSAAFGPLLTKGVDAKGDALIVNIASIASRRLGRGLANPMYMTSKSALEHLTKVLAVRFVPLKVRVNSILPGLFPSEMTDSLPKEHYDKLSKSTPIGRAGTEEEMAGTLIYLVSPAGKYMNGHPVVIDGGRLLQGV